MGIYIYAILNPEERSGSEEAPRAVEKVRSFTMRAAWAGLATGSYRMRPCWIITLRTPLGAREDRVRGGSSVGGTQHWVAAICGILNRAVTTVLAAVGQIGIEK